MSRTLSPREMRAINVLLNGAVMREHLDFIAGCSNSPELVAGLRRKGLEVPCYRVERFDKDGRVCHPGRYEFTTEDRAVAREILEVGAAARYSNTKGGR